MLKKLKPYFFPLILLVAITLGALLGYFNKDLALRLKPVGDIFLNLIFTAVVPLIFFSIASAVTKIGEKRQLKSLVTGMAGTFLVTSTLAAIFMLIIVKLFPPAEGVSIPLELAKQPHSISIGDQLVSILTVNDFSKLLSHENMLPLIFFAILVGISAFKIGRQGETFATFLQVSTAVFMKVTQLIMYYAPIGFFAYFAVLVAELGPQLVASYFRVSVIYYSAAMIYFLWGYSFYAYIAGGFKGINLFWKNVGTPSLTAFATCSSAASIPANLEATKKMGIADSVYETVIPLGSMLHKDGSVLGAIVKIAFLFGIFHMSFDSPMAMLLAIGIALLVGTVMGAIPSGGMLGEMVILSMYGFPKEALIIIAAISIVIDPIATMLNVTGNTVSTMLVARIVEGRKWIQLAIKRSY